MVYIKKGKNKKRQKKTKTKKKRGIFKDLFKGSLYLIIIVGLFYSYFTIKNFILNSKLLEIEKIVVKGCIKTKEKEIINSSGLKYKENIFSFSLKEICRKISENPWIESAEIKRKFPNTVIIEVLERTPLALLHLDGFYLLDKEGYAFKKIEWGKDKVDLPIISGIGIRHALSPIDKEKNFENKPLLFVKKALSFLNLLKEKKVFASYDISEIHIDPDFGLSLYCMKNAAQFKFGFYYYKEKLNILKKVLKDLEKRKIRYNVIDMCGYPKKVFVKLVQDEGFRFLCQRKIMGK